MPEQNTPTPLARLHQSDVHLHRLITNLSTVPLMDDDATVKQVVQHLKEAQQLLRIVLDLREETDEEEGMTPSQCTLGAIDVLSEFLGKYPNCGAPITYLRREALEVVNTARHANAGQMTPEYFFIRLRPEIGRRLCDVVNVPSLEPTDDERAFGAFAMTMFSFKECSTRPERASLMDDRKFQLQKKLAPNKTSHYQTYIDQASALGISLNETETLMLSITMKMVPWLREVVQKIGAPSHLSNDTAFQAACRCFARSIRTYIPKTVDALERYIEFNIRKEFGAPSVESDRVTSLTKNRQFGEWLRQHAAFTFDVVAEIVGSHPECQVPIKDLDDIAFAQLRSIGRAAGIRCLQEGFFFTHVRENIVQKVMKKAHLSPSSSSDEMSVIGMAFSVNGHCKSRFMTLSEKEVAHRKAFIDWAKRNVHLEHCRAAVQPYSALGIALDEFEEAVLAVAMQYMPVLQNFLREYPARSYVSPQAVLLTSIRELILMVRSFPADSGQCLADHVEEKIRIAIAPLTLNKKNA